MEEHPSSRGHRDLEQLRQCRSLQSAGDLLLLLLDRNQGCHGQIYLGDDHSKLLLEELAYAFLHLIHGGANLTGVRSLTIWRRGESSVSSSEEQVNPQLIPKRCKRTWWSTAPEQLTSDLHGRRRLEVSGRGVDAGIGRIRGRADRVVGKAD